MVPTAAPNTEIVCSPQKKTSSTQQPCDWVAPVPHQEKHSPVVVDVVRQFSKVTSDYINRIEQFIMHARFPNNQEHAVNMEDHLCNNLQEISHNQKPTDLNGQLRIQYSFETVAMEIALVVMVGSDVCLCHSKQSMDLVEKDLKSIKHLLNVLLGNLALHIPFADLIAQVSCIKDELIKVINYLVPMLDKSVLEVAKNYILEVADGYIKASHNIDPYVVTKDPYISFKDLLDNERFCQLYAPKDVLNSIQNASIALAATSPAKVAIESISLDKKIESLQIITEMHNGIHAVTSIEEIKQITFRARDKILALCGESNSVLTDESLDGQEANASLSEAIEEQ